MCTPCMVTLAAGILTITTLIVLAKISTLPKEMSFLIVFFHGVFIVISYMCHCILVNIGVMVIKIIVGCVTTLGMLSGYVLCTNVQTIKTIMPPVS